MSAKKILYFVILFFVTSLVFAQNRAILTPDSKLIPANGDVREVIQSAKLIHHNKTVKNVILTGDETTTAKGMLDTLSVLDELGAHQDTDFGFFSQDVMVQWYVAPADLYIKAVAFSVSDSSGFTNGEQVKVSIVGTDLTEDDIRALTPPTYLGYYPSDSYMNNRAPFSWYGNGDWVPASEGIPEIWTQDLWSDFGDGYPTTGAFSNNSEIVYNWVVLNDALGFEPEMIERGHIFGIAIQHGGQNQEQPYEERIGFWSYRAGDTHAGFKYYAVDKYRESGWWTRQYTWDFIAEVDLVSDRAPVISGVTVLSMTLSTEPRPVQATVTDDNPGGGNAGVQNVVLKVSTDEMASWTDITMTANGDVYSADIPGYPGGTKVYYKIVATDVEGNTSENGPYSYFIFEPIQPALLLFNGYPGNDTILTAYYFNDDPYGYAATFDLWAYGVIDYTIETSLFSNYQEIYEITSKGPLALYSYYIADWLSSDSSRNYALFGDEWLGWQNGWHNRSHGPGEFQYDVLGITYEYNDINYVNQGDQNRPFPLFAVDSSLLGGDVAASVSSYGDTLKYDPYNIYGVLNWLDAVDFETDVEVDYTVIPVRYSVGVKPAMGHRTLPAGNKIVFCAFDPLYLTSDSSWYGITRYSPLIKTIDWFRGNGGNTRRCGDADVDGNVYAYDAALTLQYSIGLITLTEQGAINANVDEDTLVSAFDAALILRHVLGMPEPVETCFESKGTRWNLPEVYKNDIAINTDNVNGTTYDFRIPGINYEDHILSLSFDMELSEAGVAEIVNLPEGYVSGINRIDSLHYRIGVINAEGLSSEDMLFRIEFAEELGSVTLSNIRLNGKLLDGTTGINSENEAIKEFRLVGNYPNPFNPSTKIAFELPKRSRVEITIYNLLGQRVATLVNREYKRGRYEVQWDAGNSGISSGVYIAVMKAGNYRKAIKMNLLK